MRILHILRYTDYFYKHFIDALTDCGAEQKILIPVEKDIGEWTKDYSTLQPTRPLHHPLRRHFFALRNKDLLSAFSVAITEFSPDLIHAHHTLRGGSLALLIKRTLGIKYVVSVRSVDVDVYFSKRPWYRKFFVDILTEAEHVIFITPNLKDKLYELLPDCQDLVERKSSIICNGMSQFWLKNIQPPRQHAPEKIRLVQTGLICDRKNQLTTFKAVELLNDRGIDANVIFVGREEPHKVKYISSLKNYIAASQHADKATFIPHQSKEELAELYRQSNIFILPSVRETFGISYIEAMGQGLPVVYSQGCGVDGIFENHVGASAEPHSPEAVADAVLQVVRNYIQLSENAVQEAKRFDWAVAGRDMYAVYRQS